MVLLQSNQKKEQRIQIPGRVKVAEWTEDEYRRKRGLEWLLCPSFGQIGRVNA